MGTPGIGVNWVELDEYGGNETFLPGLRRVNNDRPIDLEWAQGTQHTLEVMASPDKESTAAETHMIVQSGRRVYDLYDTAPTIDDLNEIRPILQRIVAVVAVADPAANAFNSVETSVNFLASLLRDATGASVTPFVSEDLRSELCSSSSVLRLLGIEALFESFSASWIRNTGAGQARVGVTLNLVDTIEEVIFTLRRDAGGSWLIIDIEPAGR